MNAIRFCVLALVLLTAGCRSACPNNGRGVSIAYIGQTVGTTLGSGAMTLASDEGVDRVVVQSKNGDPGLKYSTSKDICEVYAKLGALGLSDHLKPGRLTVGPGFEVREGQSYSYYTQPANSTMEDVKRFRDMLGVFFEYYNRTFNLQTVPEEAGRRALESTKRATTGGA